MRYQVHYQRRFSTWDSRAYPCVIDTHRKTTAEPEGMVVLHPYQFVGHPGMYDPEAYRIAQITCDALNKADEKQ